MSVFLEIKPDHRFGELVVTSSGKQTNFSTGLCVSTQFDANSIIVS